MKKKEKGGKKRSKKEKKKKTFIFTVVKATFQIWRNFSAIIAHRSEIMRLNAARLRSASLALCRR